MSKLPDLPESASPQLIHSCPSCPRISNRFLSLLLFLTNPRIFAEKPLSSHAYNEVLETEVPLRTEGTQGETTRRGIHRPARNPEEVMSRRIYRYEFTH